MYNVNYGPDGKPCSIQKGNMSIPLCADNTDYQEFLIWNAKQTVPLDLQSSIPPAIPVVQRDFGKEIDEIKAEIAELKKV